MTTKLNADMRTFLKMRRKTERAEAQISAQFDQEVRYHEVGTRQFSAIHKRMMEQREVVRRPYHEWVEAFFTRIVGPVRSKDDLITLALIAVLGPMNDSGTGRGFGFARNAVVSAVLKAEGITDARLKRMAA